MLPVEERAAWCALNTVFGFEPRLGHRLAEALGSALPAFSLTGPQMHELGIPLRLRPLLSLRTLEEAAASLEGLLREDDRFLAWPDKDYPALLRECEDPPLGLYLRSSDPPSGLFAPGRPAIAIVGTRDISSYGNEWCQRIVAALAEIPSKPLIVSGLALGVDGVAHRAALDCGLPTLGIMATGIETVYPHRHGALAQRMAAAPGSGLMTDYPPGTPPLAPHFLRRNRIIAGLCRATILVESRIRGGGMMTARLAASYGRDVLALPGRVDDLRSQGCNLLIREQTAEALNLPPAQIDRLATITGLIRERRGISLEDIARTMDLPWQEVAADAGILEADGIICMDLLQNCAIQPKNM